MSISFIFAMGRNSEIGLNNQLPWHLPNDLKFFKQVTMGHPIVMGRRTFESIGKPLPGRTNVIITRQSDFKADGCTVLHSAADVLSTFPQEKVYVIGGAELFKSFWNDASELVVTYIDESFEADTFFPDISPRDWKLVWSEPGERDENNPYHYEFRKYIRIE